MIVLQAMSDDCNGIDAHIIKIAFFSQITDLEK